ncbi:hypothetical protein HpDR86_07760 [Helicobacter pylori]
MIFEKQDYQQECINNIIALLDGFDFKRHDALKFIPYKTKRKLQTTKKK